MRGKGTGQQKIVAVAKHLPERYSNPVANAARFDAEQAFHHDKMTTFSPEENIKHQPAPV